MKKDKPLSKGRLLVYRHGLVVRTTHWINAASIFVLVLSGLQILCAHPAFYWGEVANFAHPIIAIDTTTDATGQTHGVLKAVGWSLDTTGLLGASRGPDGQLFGRAFPSWLTLPSELDLGAGRRWHFFFAWLLVLNGALYIGAGLFTRRLWMELVPTRAQLTGLAHDLVDHLRLKFPRGDAARHYGGLQRLTYVILVLGVLPLMVATGLAMSPTIDAGLPWLPILLGGRQSARTLHFVGLSMVSGFVLIHLAMVVLAGPVNLVRSMLTGWLVIKPQEPGE